MDGPIKLVYRSLIFPVTIGFITSLTLAGYISNLRLTDRESVLPRSVNSLYYQVVVFLAAAIFVIEVFIEDRDNFYNQPGVSKWYTPCLLFRSFAMNMIIRKGISYSFTSSSLFTAMGVQLVYILVLLFVIRPYRSVFSWVAVILLESTVLSAFSLVLIEQINPLRDEMQFFALMILQGLIGLSILLAFIRLYFVIKQRLVGKVKKKAGPNKADDRLFY